MEDADELGTKPNELATTTWRTEAPRHVAGACTWPVTPKRTPSRAASCSVARAKITQAVSIKRNTNAINGMKTRQNSTVDEPLSPLQTFLEF